MAECIVVTGGAGALGSALVRELCAQGKRVAIVESAHSKDRAREIVDSLGGKAFAVECDVGSQNAWKQAVLEIEKNGGQISGAAFIAGGYAGSGPVDAAKDDDTSWNAMMSGNAETVYRSLRAVLPGMVERKNGSIVVIGSRAVERPWTSKDAAAYGASKSAAVALAEIVAAEVRDSGVRVNSILPSTIDTAMNRKSMPNADASKWVKPESLAKVIAFLLSEDSRDVSGAVIPVYGRA
jgi:NAD(P)-dependent dehydrogenase (short-subunit alcohol dehydrogenase family)